MANFGIFNDKYASLFNKRITEEKGSQFWNENFIEKADWIILEKTLDLIADRKEAIRRRDDKAYITAPGLNEVKFDYYSLWREKQEEERKARNVDGHCCACMGHGWLYCAFDEHNNAIDITEPFHAPRFTGLQVAACECDKGYRVDHNAAFEWRHNNAKCGIPEILPKSHELHPMTGQQAFLHYLNKNWINQVKISENNKENISE